MKCKARCGIVDIFRPIGYIFMCLTYHHLDINLFVFIAILILTSILRCFFKISVRSYQSMPGAVPNICFGVSFLFLKKEELNSLSLKFKTSYCGHSYVCLIIYFISKSYFTLLWYGRKSLGYHIPVIKKINIYLYRFW